MKLFEDIRRLGQSLQSPTLSQLDLHKVIDQVQAKIQLILSFTQSPAVEEEMFVRASALDALAALDKVARTAHRKSRVIEHLMSFHVSVLGVHNLASIISSYPFHKTRYCAYRDLLVAAELWPLTLKTISRGQLKMNLVKAKVKEIEQEAREVKMLLTERLQAEINTPCCNVRDVQ